jgi:hypothetical protein
VPEGVEGIGAVDVADKTLTCSTVPDVEKHAIFDSVPEQGDLDPVAVAQGELAMKLLHLCTSPFE